MLLVCHGLRSLSKILAGLRHQEQKIVFEVQVLVLVVIEAINDRLEHRDRQRLLRLIVHEISYVDYVGELLFLGARVGRHKLIEHRLDCELALIIASYLLTLYFDECFVSSHLE